MYLGKLQMKEIEGLHSLYWVLTLVLVLLLGRLSVMKLNRRITFVANKNISGIIWRNWIFGNISLLFTLLHCELTIDSRNNIRLLFLAGNLPVLTSCSWSGRWIFRLSGKHWRWNIDGRELFPKRWIRWNVRSHTATWGKPEKTCPKDI